MCPGSLAGDDCRGCRTPYEYKNEVGLCMTCGCTDLSDSDTCDFLTGFCDCSEKIETVTFDNLESARICVSNR